MITLKEYMETINYRITEGSEYCWKCYGPNAYCLDSWNQQQDGHNVSIVFDTVTQEVYEVSAHDYNKRRAYRLINPDYVKANKAEAKKRKVDFDEAWDEVKFTDLEVDSDFLEKARAIVADEEYDTRVKIEIELDSDVMFAALKLAHELDITFNELVERALSTMLTNVNGIE